VALDFFDDGGLEFNLCHFVLPPFPKIFPAASLGISGSCLYPKPSAPSKKLPRPKSGKL